MTASTAYRRAWQATSRPPVRLVPSAIVPADRPAPAIRRAMAVRCVKGESPFVFGDRYHAIKGHGHAGQWLFLDVMLEPFVQITAEARLFVPENPEHWHLFPLSHRLRYAPETVQPRRRA